MSQFSAKELQLTSSVFKNFSGNFLAFVNWDQVSVDAGYKDSKNAKIMWSRLEKKLIDAAARSADDNNDDDAGDNLPATPAKAGKKRKAAGAPVIEGPVLKKVATEAATLSAGNDRDDTGEDPVAIIAKAGKKRKAAGAPVIEGPVFKREAVTVRPAKKSKGSAANVNTDGSSSKVENSVEQEGEEEAT